MTLGFSIRKTKDYSNNLNNRGISGQLTTEQVKTKKLLNDLKRESLNVRHFGKLFVT